MSDNCLLRDQAPFGKGVWERIDETVVGTARARLAGRRLLHVDGPHGLALTAFAGAAGATPESMSDDVVVRVPCLTPVPLIEGAFCLPIRDVAAFETTGALLNLAPAAKAAAACAEQEDELVFHGVHSLGLPGLMTAKGAHTCKLTAWKEVGSAVDNILQGVDKLDHAGFRGPYALALSPALYNILFRCYPQGGQMELDHLRLVVTDGIVKTASVRDGGVLVAADRQLCAIVLGQDLATAFVGPSGTGYAFSVSESAVLRLEEPAAVCVFK